MALPAKPIIWAVDQYGGGHQLKEIAKGVAFDDAVRVDQLVASDVAYTPADASDWLVVPSFVGPALDELADRVNNALTPSDVLSTKAGEVLPGSFTGSPLKATVTFAAAFADADYSISVLGEEPDGRTWTFESKTAASFVINTNSDVLPTNPVQWIVTKHGFSIDAGLPLINPVEDADELFLYEDVSAGIKARVRMDEVRIRSRAEVLKNVPSTISNTFAGNNIPKRLEWSGTGGGNQLVNFTFAKVSNTARLTYVDPIGSTTQRRFVWQARISFTCSDPNAKFTFRTNKNGVVDTEPSDVSGRGSATAVITMVKGFTMEDGDYAEIWVERDSGTGTLTVQSLTWEMTAQGNLNG